MYPWGSVPSVDGAHESHASPCQLWNPSARFVGAVGALSSLLGGVVNVTTLLSTELPLKSRAIP
jgi:hypothetical protein